jgi:hypothetical protein
VKTTLKDRGRIKDEVKGSAPLKSTVITKKRAGALFEMGKLLKLWMEDKIQNNLPLSLVTIKTKARSFFEDIEVKFCCPEVKFVASSGWFHRLSSCIFS